MIIPLTDCTAVSPPFSPSSPITHLPPSFLSKPRHRSPPSLFPSLPLSSHLYLAFRKRKRLLLLRPPDGGRTAGCAHRRLRSVVSGVASLQIEKLKWWFSPAARLPHPSPPPPLPPPSPSSVAVAVCLPRILCSHPGVKCERKWIGTDWLWLAGWLASWLSERVCALNGVKLYFTVAPMFERERERERERKRCAPPPRPSGRLSLV